MTVSRSGSYARRGGPGAAPALPPSHASDAIMLIQLYIMFIIGVRGAGRRDGSRVDVP